MKCPCCGADNAYVGVYDVRCPEKKCRHFDPDQQMLAMLEDCKRAKKEYEEDDRPTDPAPSDDFQDFLSDVIWRMPSTD